MHTPTTLTESTAPRERSTRQRWYFHRFNTPLVWKLILRIPPRLPRFMLAPLHHASSLFCFACMRRERAAARRNLRRITGKRGWSNLLVAYRLFLNFSRFMVAYTEIRRLRFDDFRGRVLGIEETERTTEKLLREGNGLIIVTAHLGHWDLGLKLLPLYGLPVHVVMLSEDPAEVTRFAEEARDNPGLRVHQMGSTPLLAVELMLALKRGEMVAVQADRPVGQNHLWVPLFGEPTPLPTGPVELAMATGAPVLPVFIVLETGGRYRILAREPMRFRREEGGQEGEALRAAMGRMASMMESVIARYPDQWFNFYDVWPAPSPGAVHPERRDA